MINELIERIEKEIEQRWSKKDDYSPYVVAIDGMSASGKTTLGKLLHERFPNSNLFHMDDYFLQPHQRTSERLSEAGGNVDYERFQREILSHLNDKCGLIYQKYNCHTQSISSEILVDWKPLVIIEGAYSHHPYFNCAYNFRIFCEVSKIDQRERIEKRNGTKMLERFVNEWIPKETVYFQTHQIKDKSDFIYRI